MKLTFNKSNWTGEDITIKVNQKKMTFELFGYQVQLKKMGKNKIADLDMAWTTYHVFVDGSEYASAIVTDEVSRGFHCIEAFEGDCLSEMALSREGETIYEAAAKVLCNIL